MKKMKRVIQTFIGPEAALEGNLVFEGTVRLDGHFKGSVESKDGTIIVSERGVIHADIWVRTAIVSGEVNGNIKAAERIELHPPARVSGDVSAPVVVIDAGVIFKGNCTIEPEDDAVSKATKLQPRP